MWFNESSDILKIRLAHFNSGHLFFYGNRRQAFHRKEASLVIGMHLLGQGIADTTFKVAQVHCVNAFNSPSFALIFSVSGITGSLFVVSAHQGTNQNSHRNVLWGILVGVPNYFTLYFFFRALEVMDASQVYPLVNMGIIVFLAFIGLLFFREKLSTNNWIGILLALVAIGLITFSKEILLAIG